MGKRITMIRLSMCSCYLKTADIHNTTLASLVPSRTWPARTRTIAAPFGDVKVSPVEELIVERVFVSKYSQDYLPALDCAKKILAAALGSEVEVDWNEVKRLANDNAYANWAAVKALTDEQAKALQVRSPYDSDE